MFVPLLFLAAVFEFTGPEHSLHVLGIRLVGINAENGKKLVFSVALIALLALLNASLRAIAHNAGSGKNKRIAFWFRQGTRLLLTIALAIGLISIWFNDTARLGAAAGLFTAGVAFALQRVVTAFSGYLLILRGKTFNVGDRIMMGGVRGDVIALGFMQTTIMEMGQPPPVQSADPAMWVRLPAVHRPGGHRHQRQGFRRAGLQLHAGVPLHLGGDEAPDLLQGRPRPARADPAGRGRAAHGEDRRAGRAGAAGAGAALRHEAGRTCSRRVYLRMTDNWLELTVRFIARDHGMRDLKDAMSRDILDGPGRRGDRRRLGHVRDRRPPAGAAGAVAARRRSDRCRHQQWQRPLMLRLPRGAAGSRSGDTGVGLRPAVHAGEASLARPSAGARYPTTFALNPISRTGCAMASWTRPDAAPAPAPARFLLHGRVFSPSQAVLRLALPPVAA